LSDAKSDFRVAPPYQPLMRMVGLDAETVFDHPGIRVWRKLPDRENCTLDVDLPDGRHIRLHIKRYMSADTAAPEVAGQRLLTDRVIPTAPLAGWGTHAGKSFTIFDDLTGYTPADKLLESGTAFDALLDSTAALTAKLHKANLHHRDLYLCHFMVKLNEVGPDLKLIDTARVRNLPGFLTRRRWIVKDIAQFIYSTHAHAITDAQRAAWLAAYAKHGGTSGIESPVHRKVRAIARHDARINARRPERNVSIPR
jgi:hypothetical protein